jgi:hypothetical protein
VGNACVDPDGVACEEPCTQCASPKCVLDWYSPHDTHVCGDCATVRLQSGPPANEAVRGGGCAPLLVAVLAIGSACAWAVFCG